MATCSTSFALVWRNARRIAEWLCPGRKEPRESETELLLLNVDEVEGQDEEEDHVRMSSCDDERQDESQDHRFWIHDHNYYKGNEEEDDDECYVVGEEEEENQNQDCDKVCENQARGNDDNEDNENCAQGFDYFCQLQEKDTVPIPIDFREAEVPQVYLHRYKVLCTLRDIPVSCLSSLCWTFIKNHTIPSDASFDGCEAVGRALSRPRLEWHTYFRQDDLRDFIVLLDRRHWKWLFMTETEIDAIIVCKEAVESRGETGVVYDRRYAFFDDSQYYGGRQWDWRDVEPFDIEAQELPEVLYGEEGFYQVFDEYGCYYPIISQYFQFDGEYY